MKIKLRVVNTLKYGEVAVSNNSTEQYLYDEEGRIIDTFPTGMVCRWIPKGQNEPVSCILPDVFTNQFKTDSELVNFLETSNLK